MPTHKDAKAMARTLRDALANRNVSFSHSESLELIARQFGFADWNTFSAKLSAEKRRLTGPGGCSRLWRAPESCVFICDECVTYRSQINADTVFNAAARSRSELAPLFRGAGDV
jgi:hypothetical protein